MLSVWGFWTLSFVVEGLVGHLFEGYLMPVLLRYPQRKSFQSLAWRAKDWLPLSGSLMGTSRWSVSGQCA